MKYVKFKYLTVSQLYVDDVVVPLSTDTNVKGKIFTVSDLHPVYLKGDEYKTVAVTLWDGRREFTNRTILYKLIERPSNYWG